jgi:hypothetical protein
LSAIQYQLERQRRERRTEDLREETLEFTEKYGDILSPIAGEFFRYSDNQYAILYDDLEKTGDDLNLDIVQNSHTPVATLYYRHLTRVASIFIQEPNPSADPNLHNLFSEKAFDRLRESSFWLKTHLDQRSMFMDNLYADLRINSNNPYTEDIFDPNPPGESIQEWLQRHQAYASRHDTLLSGENLQSFLRVFEEFHGDFQRLDSLRQNSVLTFDTNINTILLKSLALLIVGVFIPIASLITNPLPIFPWTILSAIILFIYQLTLLLPLLCSVAEPSHGDYGIPPTAVVHDQ